eukprot:2251592-Karenia_brevis.AAC.1
MPSGPSKEKKKNQEKERKGTSRDAARAVLETGVAPSSPTSRERWPTAEESRRAKPSPGPTTSTGPALVMKANLSQEEEKIRPASRSASPGPGRSSTQSRVSRSCREPSGSTAP